MEIRRLRDAAIFKEEGRTVMFYAAAGESGIAGADFSFEEQGQAGGGVSLGGGPARARSEHDGIR